MKSITRVVLPILLVAGAIFGITFIRMYSTTDEGTIDPGGGRRNVEALKFFTTKAMPAKEEMNDRGVMEIPQSLRHLQYWDSDCEVGVAGHFEFWCQNRHEQPVTVRVPFTNCQCAGAEIAVVPQDAYRDYLVGSALTSGPLCPAPGPAGALVHLALDKRLTWSPLFHGEDRKEQTVPAAAGGNPQFALVRLSWTPKSEPGPKGIVAQLYASLGDATPSHTELAVEARIVPAFSIIQRSGNQWAVNREVSVGELLESGVSKQTIYLSSTTRPFLLSSVESETNDPCITWGPAVEASEEEMNSARQYSPTPGEKPMRRVKCMYRMEVTVRERTEVEVGGRKEIRQLDLGRFDRKFTIAAANAGSWPFHLNGQVLGDVTFPSGAEAGRIELGSAFAADQDRSRDVTILADRPGLELSLIESEVFPNYLKVQLIPQKPVEGRNQYRLRVTVPKNSLFGALPEDSVVVLKTNGPNPRRLRLPVRGMTFDSGRPRI